MSDKSDEFEINAPGGWKAILRGASASGALLLILLAALFLWLSKTSEVKADQRNAEVKASLEKVEKALSQAEETQRAVIYVLSLPPEEREKLNLAKPQLLKDMQR